MSGAGEDTLAQDPRGELPPVHPGEMAHLDDATRRTLGTYWARRARSEREVGVALAFLARELHDAEPVVVERLWRGAADEARHAGLCELLAARYRGDAVEVPPLRPLRLPDFAGAPRETVPGLQLIVLCAVGESIAVTWLQECFHLARTPLARAANRLHLREEVDHARVGWAHLSSRRLAPGTKQALGPLLPRLLQLCVENWWAPESELPADGFPDEGIPSLAGKREAVKVAVEEVILPGFAHAGVATEQGQRWWESFHEAHT